MAKFDNYNEEIDYRLPTWDGSRGAQGLESYVRECHGYEAGLEDKDLILAGPRLWRTVVGLQRGLVRRPAIVPNPHNQSRTLGLQFAPQTSPLNPTDALENLSAPLPASVGHGNLMLATWVLGVGCDGNEVGNRLAVAPFDCIVLVLSDRSRRPSSDHRSRGTNSDRSRRIN